MIFEILTSPWIIVDATEGYNVVYKEDPVTNLKKVRNATSKHLAASGITHVKQIKLLIADEWTHVQTNHKVSKITKIICLHNKFYMVPTHTC